MAYAHQDWTPVVIRKRSEAPAAPKVQLPPKIVRELNDNPETFAPKQFDKAFIQSVVKGRVERKWSQKDLAARLNLDVAVIQRLEQGKEVYDSRLKDRLNRLLSK